MNEAECGCPEDGEFVYHRKECPLRRRPPVAKTIWSVAAFVAFRIFMGIMLVATGAVLMYFFNTGEPTVRDHKWFDEPIVIDPPDFNLNKAWNWHTIEVERCGGMTYEDGEVNWKAAFSADPRVCSCPRCGTMTWSFGRRQQCRECGFRYPTDSWAMYSWGVQAARRQEEWGLSNEHARRMEHPYYRYGYEHPTEEIRDEYERIDWASVFPEDAATTKGGSDD